MKNLLTLIGDKREKPNNWGSKDYLSDVISKFGRFDTGSCIKRDHFYLLDQYPM